MKLTRLSTAALFSLLLFQQAEASEGTNSEKTIHVRKTTSEQISTQRKNSSQKRKSKQTATAPGDAETHVENEVIDSPLPQNVKTKTKVVSFYQKEQPKPIKKYNKTNKYNEDYYNDSMSLAKTPMVLNGSNPSGGLPPEAVQETSYLGNWMGVMSESINR